MSEKPNLGDYALIGLLCLAGYNILAPNILPKSASTGKPGKYQIYMRQGMRLDQYLLDTETGRIWRMFDTKDGDGVWREEARVDTKSDTTEK